MSEPLSILEKIIESEKTKQLQSLDIEAEVDFLLSSPKIKKDRERDVIRLRYGLGGEKAKTLEEIGKSLNITRERVRQIEKAVFKKISDFAYSEKRSLKVINLINDQLADVGGLATFSNVCEIVLCENERKLKKRAALTFIMSLNNKVVQIQETSTVHKGYALDSISLENVYKTIEDTIEILETHKEPLEEKKLLKLIKEKKVRFEDTTIISSLTFSKKILKTEKGHFGLTHWRDINPKSIRDKTYYILKKHQKPLHYNDISKHVETLNEEKKSVTKQAVHNELIRDDRFVLIGRGIYALKEWGYREGVVEDVIADILAKAGKPLHKDDIVKEVLERRIVKETTILLNLQKERFVRVARATYTLKEK